MPLRSAAPPTRESFFCVAGALRKTDSIQTTALIGVCSFAEIQLGILQGLQDLLSGQSIAGPHQAGRRRGVLRRIEIFSMGGLQKKPSPAVGSELDISVIEPVVGQPLRCFETSRRVERVAPRPG